MLVGLLDDYDFEGILGFLVEEEALIVEEKIYGFEMKRFIMEVDKDKLSQLNREFYKDRPKSSPRKPKSQPQPKLEQSIEQIKESKEKLLTKSKAKS